ncbi:MAG: mandelate racemase/muconate lactonizing enzyme family protein [Chloroflexi bacterium]|nr:mandelate racemase/muconate lactonizing enzyme family protein [Chloroflexota bacterium]
MRITGIETFPIAIPYHSPWRNRHTEEAGRPMSHLETTVLKVHTDEGIVGLGEAKGKDMPALVAERVAPILKGRNPLEIETLLTMLEKKFGPSTILAGIDFALHDIAGKALNAPVYQLLGGKFRERVPLAWTIAYRSLEEQVLEARTYVEKGFTNVLKMKVGVPGDLERVLRVAEVAGNVPIRPDSNQGHDKRTAIEQTLEMKASGVSIEILEDPSPSDWDDYQEIADTTGVGVAIHAGWRSLDELAGIIRASKPGIKYVNIMPTAWGIRRTAQIAGALECAGIGWSMGTSHDSAIKTAASLHLATAVRNRIYPVDINGPLLRVADVLKNPPTLEAGFGYVPEGPGLGVELDEDVLKDYAAGNGSRFQTE